MSSKILVLFFMAVIAASVVGVTLPASNALTQRDWSYGYNDNQMTARYGNTAVCGDHMCAPGEWDKLQAALTSAQLGNQGGRNATQTGTVPATPPSQTTSSNTLPNGVTPKLCASVKTVLLGSGVSTTVISQVMADLGCS